MSVFFHSEGHIGLERKVTKLEAMLKMLQEDLKKVGILQHYSMIQGLLRTYFYVFTVQHYM